MDRFTFVIPKKRARVDGDGGNNSQTSSSASVEDRGMVPNVENVNEGEDEDEDEVLTGPALAASAADAVDATSAEDLLNVTITTDSETGGNANENEIGAESEEGRAPTSTVAAVPMDLSQAPAEGPRRPQLQSYPRRAFGSQSQLTLRSFNHSWFKQYSWLEYSLSADAAFCYACRHFFHHGHGHGHTEKSFTHAGFRNWRKGAEKLAQHNAGASHRLAMEGWCEFKKRLKSGSRILTQLDAGHGKIVKENRQYMRAVVESLRFTACQTIGQSGHREDEQSTNRGNFLELLNMPGKFDSAVSDKLSSGPSNAKYVHHDIQNELIAIMASMVREQVSSEVQLAEVFALMVDEPKDVSKKEQISVVLRYLNNDTIHEEFLDFIPADGLDAQSLLKSVKQTLAKCNIDKHACIAQCYDGASVMSGCNNGVQEKFRQEVPHAL